MVGGDISGTIEEEGMWSQGYVLRNHKMKGEKIWSI